MNRTRKLAFGAAILLAGIALAWPFRKPTDQRPIEPLTSSSRMRNPTYQGDPLTNTVPENMSPTSIAVAPEQISAHVASTSNTRQPRQRSEESFDLVNHPALAEQLAVLPTENEEPAAHQMDSESQPAYQTVDRVDDPLAESPWPAETRHIVRNGDTLEKLAERYLDDVGRALDIFDLNRDQLTNPHLLPIGVELRIPADPQRVVD